jgi:hypothetical protein
MGGYYSPNSSIIPESTCIRRGKRVLRFYSPSAIGAASARQSGWQPAGLQQGSAGIGQHTTRWIPPHPGCRNSWTDSSCVSFSEDRRALAVHQLPSKLCALQLDARVQVCDRRVYRQRFSGSPSFRSALRYAESCAMARLHIRAP